MTDSHAVLERSLTELGRTIRDAVHDTDLSARVVAELQHAPSRPAARVRSRGLRVALLVVAGIVASATASYAIYDLVFDGGAVTVHNEPSPAVPSSAPITLKLGEQVSLRAAADQQQLVVPTASWLRSEPRVWIDREAGGQVSLTYAPQRELPEVRSTGAGMLIQEFRGDGREVIRKYLTTNTNVEAIAVGPFRGVFLSGGDHALFYLDPSGKYITASGRLVGNAMILQRPGLTLRIEANVSRDQMVKLAASLRPAPTARPSASN